MDSQRKKGILDVCVLAAVCRNPSYGYMIMKELSSYVEITESTLYPILRRLERAGCLCTYQEGHDGRKRNYYRITADGREKIREFLDEWEEMKRVYQFISTNFEQKEMDEGKENKGKEW